MGYFDRDGAWLRGALRSADPLMCRWMAGHHFGDGVPFNHQRLQTDKLDPAQTTAANTIERKSS